MTDAERLRKRALEMKVRLYRLWLRADSEKPENEVLTDACDVIRELRAALDAQAQPAEGRSTPREGLERFRVELFADDNGRPDWGVVSDKAGDWVRYSDVAALRAPAEAPPNAPTSEQVKLHEQYVVDHAGDHDADCPGDSSCECSMKARNDAVNAVCHFLAGMSRQPAEAPHAETERLREVIREGLRLVENNAGVGYWVGWEAAARAALSPEQAAGPKAGEQA